MVPDKEVVWTRRRMPVEVKIEVRTRRAGAACAVVRARTAAVPLEVVEYIMIAYMA